jgi:hypothetical protein
VRKKKEERGGKMGSEWKVNLQLLLVQTILFVNINHGFHLRGEAVLDAHLLTKLGLQWSIVKDPFSVVSIHKVDKWITEVANSVDENNVPVSLCRK